MVDIIIDTDIGDDIDDAYALALAARSPEMHLVGVTTVFRDCVRRAQLVIKLFEELGERDIPVRAGCDTPLVAPVRSRANDRYDPKGRFIPCQHAGEYDEIPLLAAEHAVDFIIRVARENPGRVTLVGIGPLTNFGIAIRKAPDLRVKLRSILLMGGRFSGQGPEWNVLCDPEAARIVVDSGIPLSMVGLDVTTQCPLSLEHLAEIEGFGSRATRLLASWTRRWLSHYGRANPVLHDPLAVATLADPSLVTFADRSIEVALDGERRGCTLARGPEEARRSAHGGGDVRVAATVDAARFTDLFMRRILR